jgi:hypothetical protein
VVVVFAFGATGFTVVVLGAADEAGGVVVTGFDGVTWMVAGVRDEAVAVGVGLETGAGELVCEVATGVAVDAEVETDVGT